MRETNCIERRVRGGRMGGKEAVAKTKHKTKKKVEILGLAEEESREASCWKQENRAKLDEITKGGGVRERGRGYPHES